MQTLLTITDLTRMSGERVCLAGITPDGRTIRPVFNHDILHESWLYENGMPIVRPFAQVWFDLLKPIPHPPHTEDWYVRKNYKREDSHLPENERLTFLQKIIDPGVSCIFGAEIHHQEGYFIQENEGYRSLGTISVSHIELVTHTCIQDKWDYRISFKDRLDHSYRLAVTDLAFRYYVDDLRENQDRTCEQIGIHLTRNFRQMSVYLRIGLSRPTWKMYPHRCFLQVTGIYTFPDYLQGRCFADYQGAKYQKPSLV